MRLQDLQNCFQAALLQGNQEILAAIEESSEFTKAQRLYVYTNAYTARLIESLTADYPKTAAFLGEGRFSHWVKKYIQQHPSNFRSLRWYGLSFPSWLQQQTELKQADALAELAKFEACMFTAFDAPDAACLRLEYLQSLPSTDWPELKLQCHPSVQLMEMHYGSAITWQAMGGVIRSKLSQKSPDPVQWRIWRRERQVYFCSLKPVEFWAMRELIQGISFANFCQGLCDFVPNDAVALTAMSYLKTWINDELLLAN